MADEHDKFVILNCRVSAVERQRFADRCGQCGVTPSALLREFVEAFNASRLRIKVDKDHIKPTIKGVHEHGN